MYSTDINSNNDELKFILGKLGNDHDRLMVSKFLLQNFLILTYSKLQTLINGMVEERVKSILSNNVPTNHENNMQYLNYREIEKTAEAYYKKIHIT